jgi:hypothetical protein
MKWSPARHDSELNRHHIAFLIALGPVPIACAADEDDGGDATRSGGPTAGASEGVTVGPTEITEGTSENTAGPTGDPTSANDTVGDATHSPTDGDPTGADSTCKSFADRYIECYPRYDDDSAHFELYCEGLISYGTMHDGPACGQAIEDYFACLSQADCDPLFAQCPEEREAYLDACPNTF